MVDEPQSATQSKLPSEPAIQPAAPLPRDGSTVRYAPLIGCVPPLAQEPLEVEVDARVRETLETNGLSFLVGLMELAARSEIPGDAPYVEYSPPCYILPQVKAWFFTELQHPETGRSITVIFTVTLKPGYRCVSACWIKPVSPRPRGTPAMPALLQAQLLVATHRRGQLDDGLSAVGRIAATCAPRPGPFVRRGVFGRLSRIESARRRLIQFVERWTHELALGQVKAIGRVDHRLFVLVSDVQLTLDALHGRRRDDRDVFARRPPLARMASNWRVDLGERAALQPPFMVWSSAFGSLVAGLALLLGTLASLSLLANATINGEGVTTRSLASWRTASVAVTRDMSDPARPLFAARLVPIRASDGGVDHFDVLVVPTVSNIDTTPVSLVSGPRPDAAPMDGGD